MVSMKDIAERCGVSVATVSKAMNNHSDISEDTKQNIRKIAEEMGYFPNSAARALKTNRTYNIGVLYKDEGHNGLTHEYFASILEGIKAEAEGRGYDLTFINHNVGTNNMTYYEHCKYRGVDGVVIACIDFTDPEVVTLVNSSIPTVTIDHAYHNCSSVVSDNTNGMRELTQYVYSMGHRRIAYIHGESHTGVTRARVNSFRQTLEDLKVSIPDSYVIECDYRNAAVAAIRTRQLLRLEERPTCILYPDDFTCISGISEIRSLGLSVPEDISVAGYDGGLVSDVIDPPLTTIKQNTAQIGKMAAIHLIDAIEHPSAGTGNNTSVKNSVIEGGLVKGRSVKKI